MPPKIPKNVFLDTSVVNFIFKYGEQIHDGVPIPDDATVWIRRDIEALRDIWLTGQRASWRLTISPSTIAEIQRTRDGAATSRLAWVGVGIVGLLGGVRSGIRASRGDGARGEDGYTLTLA